MFDLRLKRAQVALNDGRLDEAYEVLADEKLKAQRAGQKLVDRLAKAFVRRGKGHLQSQRTAAAMEDCNRAEKLAGNLADVIELRSQICEAIQTARLESAQQADQLDKAKKQFRNGWLSTGRKMLHDADNQQAGVLLKNAEMLQVETDSASGRIEKALKHNQIELAAQIYCSSALKDGLSEQAIMLLNRIQDKAAEKIRTLLQDGDLNAAISFINRLNEQVAECEPITPLRRAVRFCVTATNHIHQGQFAQAAANLKKALVIVPKTAWIKEALEHIQKAQAAAENLQAGPLGILEVADDYGILDVKSTIQQKNTCPARRFEEQSVYMETPDNNKVTRFLLQLDGIGAYYVYCADRVTIGPVSSSIRSDIEVIAAPDVRVQQIQRNEEDYFISDLAPLHTAPTAAQLLTDGARVELSPRCRFKFTLPNPASSTACLIPSSAKMPRADVTGIILMKREILIGPGRNCHIQTGQISDTITLYLQDGHIRCRSAEAPCVDNRPLPSQAGLPVNQPVTIGAIRMTLTTRQH